MTAEDYQYAAKILSNLAGDALDEYETVKDLARLEPKKYLKRAMDLRLKVLKLRRIATELGSGKNG